MAVGEPAIGGIQAQIDRITGAKTTLANYLAQNGVSVPAGTTIEGMALLLADVIEKQNKITASGILKGDGNGNVSKATANTDYISPANMKTFLNRQTALNDADTNYTTLMARGMSLNSSETTPAVNGAIAWQYE